MGSSVFFDSNAGKMAAGGGGSLQKVFGTMPFQSKENTLFDIKRALQKGDFCSFAEKGRGADPTRPPCSCSPGVAKAKYLGHNIDKNLSWKDQYNTVKVKGGLSALQRLTDILPHSKLAAVYWAPIESHLRYGSIIWGCLSDTKLDTLQKL